MKSAHILALVVLANAASAQDAEPGKELFERFCSACHGLNADGQGPLAADLTIEVPALTGLTAANDGVFPLADVVMTIDGRNEVRGHGAPMPVFGGLFLTELQPLIGLEGAQQIVRGRILQVAQYLETLQE